MTHYETPIAELLGRSNSGDCRVESERFSAAHLELSEIVRTQVRRLPGEFTFQATSPPRRQTQNYSSTRRPNGRIASISSPLPRMIRRMAIDYTRARGAEKRGGGTIFIPTGSLHEDG